MRSEFVENIEIIEYKNLKSEGLINGEVTVEDIKNTLLEIEKSFSKYLKNSRKRWETEINEKK